MTPFLVNYLVGWLSFCLFATILAARNARGLIAEWKVYLRLLAMGWKLALFVPAIVFVTFAGRFTDDETWDAVSGGGMAVLTVLTAPWAVGALVQWGQRRRPFSQLVLALALWLFSSSWFYDGYLLLRDGAYTHRWFGNLLLSPWIYLCAGLMGNLESRASFPFFTFSFLREDWPHPPARTRLLPVLIVSLPLALVAAYILVAYVGWDLRLP